MQTGDGDEDEGELGTGENTIIETSWLKLTAMPILAYIEHATQIQ